MASLETTSDQERECPPKPSSQSSSNGSTDALQRHLHFLVLIICDVAIAILFVRTIPLNQGMMVYGNLPAFYYFGPPNLEWFVGVNFFNIVAQLTSYVIGPLTAQTAVFIVSVFLPPVSLFLMLCELRISRTLSLMTALAFGTPLNPLLFQSFLTGSFTVFLWLFFLYLSLNLVLVFHRTSGQRRNTILVCAGVLYGLSLTSTNFIPTGAYISFPILIAILLLKPNSQSGLGTTSIKGTLRSVATLCLPAAGMVAPLAVLDFTSVGQVVTGGASIAPVNSFLVSETAFEYQVYGPYNAVFGSVWDSVNGFLTGPAWSALVFLGLAGGLAFLFFSKTKSNAFYRFCAIQYLLVASLVLLFHSGLATSTYVRLKVFDSMDYPQFFLFMEQLSLIFMLPVCLGTLIQSISLAHVKSRAGMGLTVVIHRPRPRVPRRPSLRGKHSVGKVLREPAVISTLLAAVLVLVLAISSSGAYVVDSNSYLEKDQGNVFVPGFYSEIHAWYQAHDSYLSGDVIVLPNDYKTLNYVTGFVPQARIWNAPIGLPSVRPGLNVTLYEYVLTNLWQGNITSFNSAVTLSGVQTLLILTNQATVTITPAQEPYEITQPEDLSLGALTNLLNQSSSFAPIYSGADFMVYLNLNFEGLTGTANSSAAFASVPGAPSAQQTLWNATTYADYGSYPSQDVSRNRQNYTLSVFGASTIPYAVLYFNQSTVAFLPESEATQTTLRLTASLNLTPYLIASVFVLYYDNWTASFWSESQRVNLGSFDNDSFLNASVPTFPGTVHMNVVFYGWSSSSSNGTVTVHNPLLTLSVSSIDLSQSSIQANITAALEIAGALPKGTLNLAYPFLIATPNELLLQSHIVYAFPVARVDPLGEDSFSFVLANLSMFSSMDESLPVSVFITVSHACLCNASVLAFNRTSILSNFSAGNAFTVVEPIGNLLASSEVSFHVRSASSLLYLGFIVQQSRSATGTVTLSLPSGQMTVRYNLNETSWSITGVNEMQASWALPYLAVFPIATLVITLLLVFRTKFKWLLRCLPAGSRRG